MKATAIIGKFKEPTSSNAPEFSAAVTTQCGLSFFRLLQASPYLGAFNLLRSRSHCTFILLETLVASGDPARSVLIVTFGLGVNPAIPHSPACLRPSVSLLQMANLCNARRMLLFWFLVVMIFITGMAWSSDVNSDSTLPGSDLAYWAMWLGATAVVAIWLIIDFMFFDEANFLFEPSFRYALRRAELLCSSHCRRPAPPNFSLARPPSSHSFLVLSPCRAWQEKSKTW